VVGLPGGVFDSSEDVVAFQERIIFEDFLKGGSGAEKFENVGDADPLATDARAPAALALLDGDALEQFRFHVGVTVPQHGDGSKHRDVSGVSVCASHVFLKATVFSSGAVLDECSEKDARMMLAALP
jgi:hypothetical protein